MDQVKHNRGRDESPRHALAVDGNRYTEQKLNAEDDADEGRQREAHARKPRLPDAGGLRPRRLPRSHRPLDRPGGLSFRRRGRVERARLRRRRGSRGVTRSRCAARADGRVGGGARRRAGNHRDPQGLRRPWTDRGRQRPLLGDDRGAAPRPLAARRPLRQARRQRPASGTRWRNSASSIRRPSQPTTATRSSRSRAKPGSDPATRSPRSSTSSIPAARRRSLTATTTWASRRRPRSNASRSTPIACRRC